MADFTVEEIALLKKQARVADLIEQKADLQDTKSTAIGAIKAKASTDIDAVNAEYNPQIAALQTQILQARAETV